MKRRTEQYARALRDPALSAILKATFAGDTALAPSPGRTERIMRQVLASGITPRRHTFNWAPFAWTVAAAGAALLVMALSIRLVRLPAGWGPEMQTTVAQLQTPPALHPQNSVTPPPATTIPTQDKFADTPPATADANANANADVDANADIDTAPPVVPAWKAPAPEAQQPSETAALPAEEQNSPEQNQTEIASLAATLYDAGSTAHDAGDLPTAYAAYQASYDTLPMPDSLMATSDVLGRLADDELDNEQD